MMQFLPHHLHDFLAHGLIHAEIPTGTGYGEDADCRDNTEGEHPAVVAVQPIIGSKGQGQ